MDWIMKEAALLQEPLTQHRRWLHRNAEVGFGLTKTKAYVRRELEALGLRVTDCGKAGLTALLGQGEKTILLRADMDALPIPEETGLDFACPDGAMHACGHDMHTAMLLGAAKLLKDHESELPGRVKLMFQPAEEVFEGSRDMIEHGILEDPKPDAALMIHVTAGVPMPSGMVILCPPGVGAPAADYFTIRVQGKGCHGSAPHNGVDALTAASHILLALQEVHARELPAGEAAVLTIGTFQGGTAPNVIADSALLSGTIRTFSEETRAFLKDRMVSISTSIAAAYRATAEVSFGSGCPTLVNNRELGAALYGSLTELLGSRMVIDASTLASGTPGGGSEDFAYISHRVPSQMLALAAGSPQAGYAYPQHHPRANFDENVLPIGAAVFTGCALGWLSR